MFHGLDICLFFTGKTFVSRVVSEKFSRVRLGFHGWKIDFFHGLQKVFHGKKKKTLPWASLARSVPKQCFFFPVKKVL